MMNYYEINVGGKTLKLRVRMRDHAELDKVFGGGFLKALTDEEKMAGNVWGMLGDLMHIALRWDEKGNGKYTRQQVDDLLDELIDDGWTMDEAADCLMKTAATSGFFPRKVAEGIMKSIPGEMPEEPNEP